VEALFHPNKAELWLHVSLLPRISDRAAALRRRLLPLRPPGHVDSVYVPQAEMTTLRRLRRNARYTAHIAARVLYHGPAPKNSGISSAGAHLCERGIAPHIAARWIVPRRRRHALAAVPLPFFRSGCSSA
jgi:hypothetical protein